jgi:hypothetical protein
VKEGSASKRSSGLSVLCFGGLRVCIFLGTVCIKRRGCHRGRSLFFVLAKAHFSHCFVIISYRYNCHCRHEKK